MTQARTLLSGPDPEPLTDRAFEWAASTAGTHPESVLCLTQSRERADTLRRRWRADHTQLRLSCTTLDDYVGELYERATGVLANGTLGRVQRFRLVEAAIERYGRRASDGPFAGIDAPANDLIDQTQGLFSLLQYAGYDSPDAIENALLAAGADGDDSIDASSRYGAFRATDPPFADSDLAAQADAFSGLYAEYERIASAVHPEWRGTVVGQYLALLDDDRLLSVVPDSIDVVVLDGLTRLAPAEREAVARFARAYPTVAVLPLVHDSVAGDGVDAGVERALAVYRALDFELDYRTPTHVDDARLAAVRSLSDRSEPAVPYVDEDVGITFTQPATEREEVRTAARRIRALLAAGTAPTDIGVVVTDRATYRSILAEVFSAYDVPFTFVNEIGIEQTLVGDAVESLLDLVVGDSPVRSLRALAANALVSLDAFGIDADTVSRAAAKTPEQTLDRLLEALDADGHRGTAEGIRDLGTTLDRTADGLAAFVTALDEVLDALAVGDAVDTVQQSGEASGSHRPAYERSAWSAVERVLSSFDAVAPYLADDDPAERVRRAVLAELVGGPRQRPGYVRVYPIVEAELASFDHLFALGLTMGHFPSESDTMAFFEAVNDAAEEFAREHSGRRARYILGTLLTASGDVTLSIPQHTVDGSEHVPAPVVSELDRYVDRTDDAEEPPTSSAKTSSRRTGPGPFGSRSTHRRGRARPSQPPTGSGRAHGRSRPAA